MADEIKVRIVGGKEVNRRLASYSASVTSGVKQAIKDGAYKVELGAIRIVPVKTGHLKSSIATEFSEDVGSFTARVGVKGIGHPESGIRADHYGKFVEFGTRKMRARPFLYPAYLQNEAWIVERVKRACKLT